MRCPKCGSEAIPGAKFCGRCAYMFAESSSYSEPSAASTREPKKRFGSGVSRMPQGIALGVDERIVKQYQIGRYTLRQGSIDVIVTNKRVIRYEESSVFGFQNNQIDEINLDAVHGVTTHMRRAVSILGMVFALIFLFLGLYFLLNSNWRYYSYSRPMFEYIIGWGSLIVTVAIIVQSLRPTLLFSVLGSVGSSVLGTAVNTRGRLFRNDNSVVFQFHPTAETTVMLKEIGACIYDLKTLGDSAIEKWR